MVMKVPDSRLNLVVSYLKSVGKSRLGELASTCGNALFNLAHPLAIIITVRIPGLDEENFVFGLERHQSTLLKTIKEYGLENLAPNRPPLPNNLSITTDDGKTIGIGIIKHLGNPVGQIAAITEETSEESLPLSEALWLCSSQISVRLHSLLTPAGLAAIEMLGRQLLAALKTDGIRTLTIGSATGGDAWMSLYRNRDKTIVREIERLPQDQVASINDGEVIGENTLKYLWDDLEVAAGIWVSTQAGYYLAVGFEDRKHINPRIADRIRELIELKAKDDSTALIKSFEKLKADFQKLVKSERAAAITETTVTINHEINNPLTAILGNTQLMLMSRDKLPADIVAKLETIERSAIKIRETTAKLMSIIEPVTRPYASGLQMIDIEKSKKKKPQENP
jgi:hypothetical protein